MSLVLFITNLQEDVSKVHSCKVAPSLACVFWVVGEESRGAVVEWGEQEVVRHLSTLQGEVRGSRQSDINYYLNIFTKVCSVMSIGGCGSHVAALLADSRLAIWSWRTGVRTLILPLKMLPEPETVIRIHQVRLHPDS